jgi:HPr kinase/phosphorylase
MPGPPDGLDAVLLLGASGSGKSDLLLRLLDRGWLMVADDQVLVTDGMARAPQALAGILEVRGLGLFHMPFVAAAPVRLIVKLGVQPLRLPQPERDGFLGLPVVTIDAASPSAPERVALALEAARGRVKQIAGAFAP